MAGYPGYLSALKATVVEALLATFDSSYPEPDFRSVKVGIEFPATAQDYPGIWADFDDDAPLQNAGIAHYETVPVTGGTSTLLRWKFQGSVSLTVVALSSLERDRLYDELVRVLAFGRQLPATARFRSLIESNDLLALNFDFDTFQARGNNASPGTPWNTDEFIYEKTININVIGEFVADPATATLVNLSKIILDPPGVYPAANFPTFVPGTLSTDWV